MRPLLQHASRSIRPNASLLTPIHRNLPRPKLVSAAPTSPAICLQCQFRASSLLAPSKGRRRVHASPVAKPIHQRSPFSTKNDPNASPEPSKPSERSLDEPQHSAEPIHVPPPKSSTQDASPEPLDSARQEPETAQPSQDNIKRVPDEALPSHREQQRWNLSKRAQELMDELLPKLAVVTQKVNTYTGTDYSGIAALKHEIKEQERLVKARRAAVETAKQALDAALAHQASAQKEVVALLERKHSWSAADLERYMSLIRSEHVNDQAIHAAKDNVLAAETALEEARVQLEKRERSQYHEEQIWSDTIRRNSTWVTFGLMGVNIVLLLSSLLIFEPWRRRRLVREIQRALDAQMIALEPAMAAQQTSASISHQAEPVKEVLPAAAASAEGPNPATDQPITSNEPAAEPDVDASPISPSASTTEEIELAADAALLAPDVGEMVENTRLEPSSAVTEEAESPLAQESPEISEGPSFAFEEPKAPVWIAWKKKITTEVGDLVSERAISIRKVDFTVAILQGVAAGACLSVVLLRLLRPN